VAVLVQLVWKADKLREAQREAERDKERIDAIISRVNDEDRQEIEERNRRKVGDPAAL
jgi:hypothetical protein